MFLGEEKGKRVNVERATELAATGAGGRHGVSVLPNDVSRCAGDAQPDAAQIAGHRTVAAASIESAAGRGTV
jgi:hypothetical protein